MYAVFRKDGNGEYYQWGFWEKERAIAERERERVVKVEREYNSNSDPIVCYSEMAEDWVNEQT